MLSKLPKILTILFILFVVLQISSFLFLNLFYLPAQAIDIGQTCDPTNDQCDPHLKCDPDLKLCVMVVESTRLNESKADWEIPDLQIDIPTAELTEVKQCPPPNEDKMCVPWINQYIAGIYKYAIGIVGILATVVMMMGGIMWIMAGGNATRVGEAKAWIGASLTGLVLALTSYTILYQINPKLTQFKPIEVTTVKDKCGGCPENYTCENINPTTGGNIEIKIGSSDYECISTLPGKCTFSFYATNKKTGKKTIEEPKPENLANEKKCIDKLYDYYSALLKDKYYDWNFANYEYQPE